MKHIKLGSPGVPIGSDLLTHLFRWIISVICSPTWKSTQQNTVFCFARWLGSKVRMLSSPALRAFWDCNRRCSDQSSISLHSTLCWRPPATGRCFLNKVFMISKVGCRDFRWTIQILTGHVKPYHEGFYPRHTVLTIIPSSNNQNGSVKILCICFVLSSHKNLHSTSHGGIILL